MVKATQLGMGAIPGNGSTTFRVWAPHAGSVSVAGNFNNWSGTAYGGPLCQDSGISVIKVDNSPFCLNK